MFNSLARFMLPTIATAVVAAPVLAACGGQDSAAGNGQTLPVAAAFYPLQFAAQEIGGARVAVSSLTKPGGEPHDLELTPKDLARMTQARVVIYEGSFQPAVDEAVAGLDTEVRLDVAKAANLDIPATEDEHGHEGASAESEQGHGQDPHFWLDPIRYAAVGHAIGERLAKADPVHAAEYRSRADAFGEKLRTLDQEFATGLASCSSKDLVTGHAAFAYLAARYGLHQEAITISPDEDPTAAQMRDVTEHIREHGVTTVYSETLVSPAVAEAVAREAGARVAVLDPIEGITTASAGSDYFQIMRSNLATLRKGQGCA